MLGINDSVEVGCVVASVALFLVTLVAMPVFFAKVPEDYFVRPRARRSPVLHAVRLVVGIALVALGVAMVVLPGQGLLTILVGVSILDVPIKDRIVARLLAVPSVNAAIATLRQRAGKGALIVPSANGAAAAT